MANNHPDESSIGEHHHKKLAASIDAVHRELGKLCSHLDSMAYLDTWNAGKHGGLGLAHAKIRVFKEFLNSIKS